MPSVFWETNDATCPPGVGASPSPVSWPAHRSARPRGPAPPSARAGHPACWQNRSGRPTFGRRRIGRSRAAPGVGERDTWVNNPSRKGVYVPTRWAADGLRTPPATEASRGGAAANSPWIPGSPVRYVQPLNARILADAARPPPGNHAAGVDTIEKRTRRPGAGTQTRFHPTRREGTRRTGNAVSISVRSPGFVSR